MKKNLNKILLIVSFLSCFISLSTAQTTIGFSIQNKNIAEKDTFSVAINADSLLTGKGVYAYKFGISYNSGYVEYLGIDSIGITSKNWNLPTVNNQTLGKLYIANAGTQSLTGKGGLIYLRFRAIKAGYTYIENIPAFSMLNEGSPALTVKYAFINATALPFPDIYPDSKSLYVGENVQMTVNNGTPPYTFGSTNPAIATVNTTGYVTAITPGLVKIFTTDAKGNQNYTTGNIDVRGVRLSVMNSSTSLFDTLYLPIKIDIAPGTTVYSGSFDLTYNANLEGIKSNIQNGDFSLSLQNNASGTTTKVSFASANGISGSGILCNVAMRSVNSGTHSVNIENALFNENLTAFTTNGTIGVECKPTSKVTGMLPANNEGNLNTTLDLYWQASLNTRSYQLFLWENGTLEPTSAFRTVYATNTRLYNLKPGQTYSWKIIAVNECSNVTSDVQAFSTKLLPDLIISDIQTPKEIESGNEFTVSFTVKNIGQTATVASQWRDIVYISTDSAMNGSKTQLMLKYNIAQLAINETYTQSYKIKMPAEYKGKYYIFARADVYNELTELSEENNTKRFGDSIIVALKPFPDVKVKEIQAVTASIIPGDSLLINWKIENIGQAKALGGWSERVTLVSANGTRIALTPILNYSADLDIAATINRSHKFKIPTVLRFSGTANIEVELYPSATLVEYTGTSANNKALSANTIMAENVLFLDIATTSLSEGSTADVRCVITRSGDYTSALPVNIVTTPSGQITIPSTVTIPLNMSSEIFNLKAIDNAVVDGTRDVSITVSATAYPTINSNIQMLDNEATTLQVSFDKNTVNEGDSLKLTITRNLVTNTPLLVYLSANRNGQLLFDNAATIPANATQVIVPFYVIDDKTPELNEPVTITISSGGYGTATAIVNVVDDDMPVLEFTLSADTVSETGGMYASYGTIRRETTEGSITIKFSSSIANALILPSTITIPNGTKEAKFNIGVVDNGDVDEYRDVLITAALWVQSCNCNTTPENGGVVTKNIVIADNDGPTLTATVNPVSLFEGRVKAGKLIISRNTATTNSLTVSISHNDPSEITLATSAVIPAGEKSVEVPITTLNDGIEDGNQMVNITVQATGFTTGFCVLFVTDLNKPDFVLRNVNVNKTSALTKETIQVTGKLINEGFLNAPMGSKVGFYLSKDNYLDENNDQLLGTYTTTQQLLMGDSISFTETIQMPTKTGNYKLLMHANPRNTVSELVYTNNTAEPIAITVQPEYTATAIVDLTQTLPNTAITVYGKATLINLQPAANVNVDVYLMSNGTRKELKATTNAQGDYSVIFNPLPDESGYFEIGACYPEEGLKIVQDNFNILGVKRTSTSYITWLVKIGLPFTGKLQLKNTSNIELKNVKMKLASLPEGCTINATTIASFPGNSTMDIDYTITGTVRSKTVDYQKLAINVSSDEGVNIYFDAYYYCQEQEAVLVTSPVSINTTISKGTTKYFEFTLTNKGGGESGIVRLTLPKVNYLSLVSSDSIANIKSGESVAVTLKLTDTDLSLNTPVSGTMAINCEHGKGITLPYKLEAVSDAKGSIKIDVLDEYSYNTTEAPHVENAHVIVRHPYSGSIVADGYTGADGVFEATDIPEGYYTMTIEADKHEGYRNNIIIDAGKTLSQSIFISFQAISYTWEVVRTEVEDEYKIDLIMKFETNVPAPVVIMEMPDTMPKLINNETYPFMVTLTNKGLITAVDVELKLPTDPEYEFFTNFTKMDLLAQQSIQVPVVMKRRVGYSGAPGIQKASASSLNCFDVITEVHGFYCGPDKKWHSGVKLFTFAGRVCSGSPGTGGSGYSGSGPSLGGGGGNGGYVYVTSNNPTLSVNSVTNCDNCLTDLSLTLLGCIPGPIGAASGVASCLKSFGDGVSVKDAFDCGVGFIPVWGCIYGLFNTAYTCYQDPPNIPFPPIPPVLLTKKLSPQATPKPLMPPIIKQAITDLLWVGHSMDADKKWMNEFTGINSMFTRVNFADFASAIDPFTVFKKKMEAIDIINVNQKLYGTDILASEVDAFAVRWNSTLDAYAQNVFAPNVDFPSIINRNKLDEYKLQSDSARAYAISRGYVDVREMANMAYETTKEQIETGKKSVCASITLQISQKLVMTREAFEGTLTITNGNTQTAMTKIKLNLEVKNSQGIICNDLFQINTKALSILTGIDGNGSLAAGQKGSASILFIPEKGAAPQLPTSYSFGGTFSYIDPFNGLEVTKTLFPITLDVNPSPDLALHYFMQRDILGDDPLTEVIEPIIPAELALMIQNNGYGTATKVRVESAQPEIIENEKGLAIHVALIGSNLNGQPKQLGLTNIDFGNIAPKTATIGQWWFTSDLLGHFVNYETRVVHANSFGNPDLSLISEVKLHELIRSVRVYNNDDGINDFLVNEVQDSKETPDMIYTSNGLVLPVAPVNSISTSGTISSPTYELQLSVSPKLFGWNYGKVTDPTNGRYKIVSVTRNSDGKTIPIDNVWQTHITLPDGFDPIYEHKIHIVDDYAAVQSTTYTLKFAPGQIDPPTVLRIENVPTSVITTRLSTVRVIFEKPILVSTFDYNDMILRVQGGNNLMTNAVQITKINDTSFDVDISAITLQDGYYVLTVQTTDIENAMGESGQVSAQASWSQFTNTPAVQEFIGLPEHGVAASFNNLMLKFTVPINSSTFTADKLIWTKEGIPVTGTVTITAMDTEGKLFKIMGLNNIITTDGAYRLTVDLLQIKSQANVFGMFNQSVDWRIDTKIPEIAKITLKNEGGNDKQHITSIEVKFDEPVLGFGISTLELWKDAQQQPISQLNYTKVNDSTYLITDFRLLTYNEGNYSLKINMAGITDMSNNVGVGIVNQSWIVNRTTPAAITNLKISPDLGYSAVDGITSTQQVSVSMKVNAAKSRVRLYYNSFGVATMLADTMIQTISSITLPVTIPTSGNMKIQAECIDSLDNKSLTEIDVYIDNMPLSVAWNNIPNGILRKHPTSVLLDFSDKLLTESTIKDNLVFKMNGEITTINSLTVTKKTDNQFAVGGFGNKGVDTGGTFMVSVDVSNLNKYTSGKSGLLSTATQWSLRGNKTPIANAGNDQTTTSDEKLMQLDGTNSSDADNDLLTYNWTSNDGIQLINPTSAKPTFILPTTSLNKLTFNLVVNDGVFDSALDDIVVFINKTSTGIIDVSQFTSSVSISPNPSYNDFMLKVREASAGELNIRIYNNYGQMVYHKNINHTGNEWSYTFRKLELISGIYYVDVKLNNTKHLGLVKLINIK